MASNIPKGIHLELWSNAQRDRAMSHTTDMQCVAAMVRDLVNAYTHKRIEQRTSFLELARNETLQ